MGRIHIPTPTCADDVLFMASNLENQQTMVSSIAHYAKEEHYIIHPLKSVVVKFNIQSKPELHHVVHVVVDQFLIDFEGIHLHKENIFFT